MSYPKNIFGFIRPSMRISKWIMWIISKSHCEISFGFFCNPLIKLTRKMLSKNANTFFFVLQYSKTESELINLQQLVLPAFLLLVSPFALLVLIAFAPSYSIVWVVQV